jgi:hypothetical protein
MLPLERLVLENPSVFEKWSHVRPSDIVLSEPKTRSEFLEWVASLVRLLLGIKLLPGMIAEWIALCKERFYKFQASFTQSQWGLSAFRQKSWLKDLLGSETSYDYRLWIVLGLLLGLKLLLPGMIEMMIPHAMSQFGTVVMGTGTYHAPYAQGGFAAFLQKVVHWMK